MSRADRVESLFAAALQRPAAERELWVAEHANDDAERDEVLSLLAHHVTAGTGGGFLDTPAARLDQLDQLDQFDRIHQSADVDVVGDLAAGEAPLPRIEGFDVLEVLGRGGMGVVYRAEQHHPHRFVALKVVDPGQSSPALLQRLRREAESLARLEHPGIARLYQAGSSAAGSSAAGGSGPGTEGGPGAAEARPWFAMELVEGQPLMEFAATRHLGLRERVELLARIADAVHYAHTRGVVHRDIKPANVLVVDDPTTADDPGSDAPGAPGRDPVRDPVRGARPKVLDFGVARLTGSVEATRATEPGRLVGTLGWMSPEQCEAGGEVDARTDVYALGVMAYELLGGRHPHELAGLSLPAALRTMQEQDPPPPSTFDERLRGDLDTIVAKAMEKDPARRYPAAAELAADLRRHLRDEPITARPATTFDRALRFGRRHRLAVGAALAVVAVLSLALVAVSREAGRARDAEQLAAGERDAAVAAEADMREALALLDELVLAADPYRQGRAGLTMGEVLVAAADDLDRRRDLGADLRPRVRAHLAESLGHAFHGLRDHVRAVRWLEEAREGFVALAGPASPDALRAGGWLAAALADDGRLDEAQHLLEVELEPHLPALDEAPLLHHRVGIARVRLARQRGEPQAAATLAATLVERAARFGLGAETVDATRSHLVRALSGAGRHDEAYVEAGHLLAARAALHGELSAPTLGAVEMLLREADALGRVDEAADLAERLMASLPLLGADHADRLVFLQIAARALRGAGRFGPAAEALDEALASSVAVHGEGHATTLALRNSRVLLWQQLGRSEALAELEALAARCAQELGPADLTAAVALNLAQQLAQRGDTGRALELQEGALAWYRSSVGDEAEATSTARAQRGATLLLANRLDEAWEALSRAREEQVRRLGPDHPTTLDTANNLAVTLKRLGRLDEAEPLFASLVDSAVRTYPEGHGRRGVARLTWALCLLDQQRLDEAGAQLTLCHHIFEGALPAGHPYRLRTLQELVAWCEATDRDTERDSYAAALAAESP